MSNNPDVITAINMYPFKSCQAATVEGAKITSATVGMTGFEINGVRDRDYVLYDAEEQCMVTQRGWGAQGQKVKYPQDRQLAATSIDIKVDHVAIQAPVFGRLEIGTADTGEDQIIIDIFGKKFAGLKLGGEPDRFFSDLLQRPIKVIKADRNSPRYLPDRYCRPGAANQVAGADGMPFLLLNQASLDAQHVRNDLPLGSVPINCYRGNLVVAGEVMGPFAEDCARTVKIKDTVAYIVKACARCPIPNVDQVTGEQDGAALRVLRGRAGTIFTGETGVYLGQNLNHIYEQGQTISVGDEVTVLETADEPNVMLRTA